MSPLALSPEIQTLIERAIVDSHRTPGGFGQLVRTLSELGIESYRVDYREAATTLFAPSGASHRVALDLPSEPIADTFDAGAVGAAIHGAQSGTVLYPEFLARSLRAGSIGYVVWLSGGKVGYFGRRGELHEEHFPS